MKTRIVKIKTLKEIKKISKKTELGFKPESDVLFNKAMIPIAGTVVILSFDGDVWGLDDEYGSNWTIAEWMIERDLNPHDDPEYYL